jgi:protein-S-isoprenylcysteine O-methyltransferase Ste14
MNIQESWNIVYLAGFAVYFWTRHVFLRRTRNEKKTLSRFDRSEKILLAAMFPPVILLPLLYLFTPLLAFADYRLPPFVLWSGAVVMVASLWLFWRSHADLGQNWSVSLEIREGHQLVTHGVYRYIRHPMYSSIWLWGIAQGLLLQNWLAGWAVVPVFAVMYVLRTPREERMMCEMFGEQYREYMRRTGRLLPRLVSPRVPRARQRDDRL